MRAAPAEEELFQAARRLDDPSERDEFLRTACGPDAALRERVEALLAAYEQTDNPLDRRPAGLHATGSTVAMSAEALLSEIAETPGVVIGAYKLLEKIGEGGFGVVFMAEQQHPVRRKVALKVLKPGMDTREVVARFEAERQALALMDHPNIAKVLDGGATESGRPYFVMELVKGIPITNYCDGHRLTPRERLRLFVPVCRAVQHAHAKGVIHRDLKPSNVLVAPYDGNPVPKVIDFGVAKAMGGRLTERTLFTGFGSVVGTLEYMSPEQAELNQLDVDTRSDVYSLGVLLYELLTGSTPLERVRLVKAGLAEALRVIREEDPPAPSTRISSAAELPVLAASRGSDAARLGRLLRGELDWIVMKALEKDRGRRYETVHALAKDLERYLADEPVEAGRPSRAYRLRKLIRRHKAGVLAAAAVAAGLLVAVGSLTAAVRVLSTSNAEIRHEQGQTEAALGREKRTSNALASSLGREELTSYFQRIAAAERELAAGDLGRAGELLDECPAHLRGWEWHYLNRRPYGPVTLSHDAAGGASLSPDGRLVAASASAAPGATGEIRVWDRSTGRLVHTLRGHVGTPWGPTFTPDGKRLASSGWEGAIKVWDVASEREVVSLSDPLAPFGAMAFDPSGRFFASAGWKGALVVRDATSLRTLHTLGDQGAAINSLAFGDRGRRLVTAGHDGTVRIWDPATGEALRVLIGHTGPVMDVTFGDPPPGPPLAGRPIVSAGFDGTVKLWDADSGKCLATIRAETALLTSAVLSPDGTRLAAGGFERAIRLWDVRSGQLALTLRGHADTSGRLAFSPDGRQLVSSSSDGTVKVWDASPSAGADALTLRGHAAAAVAVAFHPDGRRIASAGLDGTVRVWNATTGLAIGKPLRHDGPVGALAFSGDGSVLASCSFDGTVKLWDVATARERRSFRGFAGSVAFSRDGARVASASTTGAVTVWDAATGKEVIPPFKAHQSTITGLAFSPDGRRLATASMDRTVKIWDSASGELAFELKGHGHVCYQVAFSSDGARLATASWDGTAKVWDAADGKELHTFRGHGDRVFGVAFSPDGTRLATASWDNTARVWDAATGAELAVLRTHVGHVFGVAFSPDGERLATASGYRGRGEVKIWDAAGWGRATRAAPEAPDAAAR